MARRPFVFAAVALSVVAMLAMTTGATADSKTDRATGGGQILFSTNPGAGNTIAFTAQGTADAAKGQVQFIDRSAGNGRSQVKYHGDVTCIIAEGNTAKIAGVLRNGDFFNLYVQDTGEGHDNSDPIFFDSMVDTPDCDFDVPSDNDLEALARGNAQVHDADD